MKEIEKFNVAYGNAYNLATVAAIIRVQNEVLRFLEDEE